MSSLQMEQDATMSNSSFPFISLVPLFFLGAGDVTVAPIHIKALLHELIQYKHLKVGPQCSNAAAGLQVNTVNMVNSHAHIPLQDATSKFFQVYFSLSQLASGFNNMFQ